MRHFSHLLFALAILTLSNYGYAQSGSTSPLMCDADGDSDVDRNDIRAISMARNASSTGPGDMRDSNGDGKITVLDARKCTLACTLPRCAVPPPPDTTPPALSIDSPADGATVNDPTVVVSGTATDAGGIASVTVNGIGAILIGDTYSVDVSLVEGGNLITVVAVDGSGNTDTVAVTVMYKLPTPSVSLNLHKVGSSTGVLSIKTELTEDQVCGIGCDNLPLELPQGTLVTLEAQSSAGTILWSWGGLPCDQLSNSCQFVLEEDIKRYISFENAELASSTFPVPAEEASEYEDPFTGVRVTIPAGATLRPTSVSLHIATNERGERLFLVEILEPDDWVQGLHKIAIDMTALSADVQPLFARVQALSAEEPAPNPNIYPRQPFVPFVSYKPGISLFKVENRLVPAQGYTCYQNSVVDQRKTTTPMECSYKEHALTVARCTDEKDAAGVCGESAWPVILINGYQPGDGTEDDLDLASSAAAYWNDLPYALHTDGFAPYTFRWKSAQRFQDAAASLREAVGKVSARHQGKAPVLVAHSFGGLVARMYAQGGDNSPAASAPAESELRGVITIGTPHSGIATEGTIEGNRYPLGVGGSWVATFIDRCRQISCYQAGLDVDYFPDIQLGTQQDFRNLFGIYFAGETIDRLSYPGPGQDAMRVPLKILIGLKEATVGGASKLLTDGDGLITWQGQRFHPELSCNDLTCEALPIGNVDVFVAANSDVFGNTVTEQVLGALNVENKETLLPGELIPSGFSPYAHSPKTRGFGNSYMRTQAGIFRDEHVDVEPRQHDVLLVVLETLEEWTGGTLPPSVGTVRLNDTGITFGGNFPSAGGFAGNNIDCTGGTIEQQDCSHGRDATQNDDSDGHAGFSFTKLDSNGTELLAGATSWSCVKDNVTGLVWEVKTDDGGIHDKDNTYRWGGKTRQGDGYGDYYPDWDILVDGSNAEAMCGYDDWRVPTVFELQNLVNYGRDNPAIDIGFFPNTSTSEAFWSASPWADSSAFGALCVYFYTGNPHVLQRDSISHVRLVRSGQ